MCDSDNNRSFIVDTSFTRRSVVLTLSSAADVAAFPGAALAANVVETDVLVRTPDGSADAARFPPARPGSLPPVVMWPDIRGLRPVFRDMGRRLAAQGYTVLVPNPFYRTRKAPVLSGPFDFANPDDRAKLVPLTAPLTTEAKAKDGAGWVAFLDTLPQVKKSAPIGVYGYCMGGPYTML